MKIPKQLLSENEIRKQKENNNLRNRRRNNGSASALFPNKEIQNENKGSALALFPNNTNKKKNVHHSEATSHFATDCSGLRLANESNNEKFKSKE